MTSSPAERRDATAALNRAQAEYDAAETTWRHAQATATRRAADLGYAYAYGANADLLRERLDAFLAAESAQRDAAEPYERAAVHLRACVTVRDIAFAS